MNSFGHISCCKLVIVNAEPKAQQDSFESVKRQFTYSEIVRITNNFERILGKGGFGTVYNGFIDESTQVAVKMLSSSSVQGYQQFQAEACFFFTHYIHILYIFIFFIHILFEKIIISCDIPNCRLRFL